MSELIFTFLSTSVGSEKTFPCRPDLEKLFLILLGKDVKFRAPRQAYF